MKTLILITFFLCLLACGPLGEEEVYFGSGHPTTILGQPSSKQIEYFDQGQSGPTCSHATAANMIQYSIGINPYNEMVKQFTGGNY